jgi:hypothetical protein
MAKLQGVSEVIPKNKKAHPYLIGEKHSPSNMQQPVILFKWLKSAAEQNHIDECLQY